MDHQLKDKVALITGGTTGMGYAAAALFLKHGTKVIIAGRREEEGSRAAAELKKISPDVRFIKADVSKSTEVERLVSETVNTFGRLDIAFNNAGIEGAFAKVEETTEEEFDQLMEINLKGVWLSCKYEIAQFKRQNTGGAIVNTSSWLARGAFSGSGIYSASKAALESLVRVMAVELGGLGIRVNNVNPGYIDTPMSDRFFPDPASKVPFEAQVPLKRFGNASEVAELVVWLSGPASSYITGESILVDGGLTISGQRS
ncbi:SDR family NAD(P)-dependent oxidoreductase [Mucilaginibacter jinjuensis]|uniref:Glucose 1-dehydrogenase n=1 Tax=Mucilaginibacter jinjuensis TaxID=1176721 RepID=A0ABY7TCK7_9SPHI|nr:glucose 1-dehydrogenase [Mucilaginibacter jinjuensis]WCT13362.1 glucose 1-dehydrogenase [Mucilaginibacter jinjuensis]